MHFQISTSVTELFHIKYPIIQGGMIWVAGWKLASAVSKAGGLGLIGSGSMNADLLRHHIKQCQESTDLPFGVNIPMIRDDVEELVGVALEEGVKIVFTSAGNPAKFTDIVHKHGGIVAHVVPSVGLAKKAEERGVDAIVAEGTEAGGHNGVEEITTMALVPQVVDAVKVPVIAAGGIADGRGIYAALALGASGVQMGTRFACTLESSAHPNYCQAVVEAKDNSTILGLKKIGPVRMVKNPFAQAVIEAERRGATEQELAELLGKGRARKGIFEGDLTEGEIEAGQSSGLIQEVLSVAEVMDKVIKEFGETQERMKNMIAVR
jgi:enoyl-[acyl-carrier protein] reductase II